MRAVIELMCYTVGMTLLFVPFFIWLYNDTYTVEYILRTYYYCYIIGIGLIMMGVDVGDNG